MGTIITATSRARGVVPNDSLENVLTGPLAQQAPAGFLFWLDVSEEARGHRI